MKRSFFSSISLPWVKVKSALGSVSCLRNQQDWSFICLSCTKASWKLPAPGRSLLGNVPRNVQSSSSGSTVATAGVGSLDLTIPVVATVLQRMTYSLVMLFSTEHFNRHLFSLPRYTVSSFFTFAFISHISLSHQEEKKKQLDGNLEIGL